MSHKLAHNPIGFSYIDTISREQNIGMQYMYDINDNENCTQSYPPAVALQQRRERSEPRTGAAGLSPPQWCP